MALDDAHGLVGLFRVDRDAHLAELVDRQRKHRVGHRRGRERLHAVGLEQAPDDAASTSELRAEDDDEVSHPSGLHARSRRPPATVGAGAQCRAPRPSAGSWSCRRAAAHRRQTPRSPRRIRSRNSSDGRSACCSTSRARRASPKQSSPRVHGLADAVGEEHVAGRPSAIGSVRSSSIRSNMLAFVELQPEHHAVRGEDFDRPAVGSPSAARQRHQRRVARPRVGHRAGLRGRSRHRSS